MNLMKILELVNSVYCDMENKDDDDDMPILSQEAKQALQEFLDSKNSVLADSVIKSDESGVLKVNDLMENWQLSQFWYSDNTASKLAEEICNEIPDGGKIALIGCPSLYYFVQKRICNKGEVKLLDIDCRFKAYKNDFFVYDYNNPLPPYVPEVWKNTFDFIALDPPFLSDECITKCASTAKFLMKDKVMVCSGLVMENLIYRLLGAKRTYFEPKHKHNLGNQFACFINYISKSSTFSVCDSSR